MYKKCFKRLIDLAISIIALPFVTLISVLVMPLIILEDCGSLFYVSKRLGRDGNGFDMYKFRSMKVNSPDIRTKDNETYNSENDPRLTKVGKIIRKTSIDELPQIINVIKGDMSIIGPRPHLKDRSYDELSDVEKKRIEVRPGITGFSQAFFRNSISIDEKFENDVYYVEHLSFLLDCKVFVQTIKSILIRSNVYNTPDD